MFAAVIEEVGIRKDRGDERHLHDIGLHMENAALFLGNHRWISRSPDKEIGNLIVCCYLGNGFCEYGAGRVEAFNQSFTA